MTPGYQLDLRLLDDHLGQVVPRDADPELFNEHGRLMDRELKAYLERAWRRPTRPRVGGYLGDEVIDDAQNPA